VLADEINSVCQSKNPKFACIRGEEERQVKFRWRNNAPLHTFFCHWYTKPDASSRTYPTAPNLNLIVFLMRIQLGYPRPSSRKKPCCGNRNATSGAQEASIPYSSFQHLSTRKLWFNKVHVASGHANIT